MESIQDSAVDESEAGATPVQLASAPPSGAVTAVELPALVIQATTGWRSIGFAELWRYRELLFFFTWRDVKVRYKQTVLGATWAIIQPVMTMIVFTIFFGRLGGMGRRLAEFYPDLPYQVFVYAALLPWTFFAHAVGQSGQSMIHSERLISKVFFPRLIIPIASVGASLVDFFIAFLVMLGMMIWYGVGLTWYMALLPLVLLGTTLAALGAGITLAAFSVSYRDFRYVIPFMIQIWMFASPVAYPLEVIPESWKLAYSLNPMTGMISGFRSALLGQSIRWDCLAVSFAVAIAMFVVGAFIFRRVERRFADIV